MTQSGKQNTPPKTVDPLEGYRRISNEEFDDLTREVNLYRSLAEDDEDRMNLSLVMKRNRLQEALRDESSALRRLVNHVDRVLTDAQSRWLEVSDPRSQQALDAHRDARAARLVIDWIEDQISIGNQAERQLED